MTEGLGKVSAVASRCPGRPKDLVKRAAIIAAADTLLRERGYEGMTMDAVAEAASVSKMTVYSHFHDKEALFIAVVRAACEHMLAVLDDPELGARCGLRPALVALGKAYLQAALSPRAIALRQQLRAVLVSEHTLAAAFYAAGPGRARALLADMIAAAVRRGELDCKQPAKAADDLLGLWVGDLPYQLALALIPPLTPEEIEQRARHATEVFLRAYGTDRTAGS